MIDEAVKESILGDIRLANGCFDAARDPAASREVRIALLKFGAALIRIAIERMHDATESEVIP